MISKVIIQHAWFQVGGQVHTHERERLASRRLQQSQYRSSSELVGTTEGEGGVCGKFNIDYVSPSTKKEEGGVSRKLTIY